MNEICECPNCGRSHWKLANNPPQAIAGPSLLKPAVTLPPSSAVADHDATARHCARPIRGCATDEQYSDVIRRTEYALSVAQYTGFKHGIDAAIEHHTEAADDIRSRAQLEPSSYDVIGFHEESIEQLNAILPGRRGIEKRLCEAEDLLRRIAGEIGFAADAVLVKRIDDFMQGRTTAPQSGKEPS